MSVLLLILGIVLFTGLILAHEWGHFIMARRNGVEVEEYALFFPPRLYKRMTKGGWLFAINLLPVGGYVKLKGEHDADTEPGTFGAASLLAKSKIMAAGVVVNYMLAVLLFTIVALAGMPQFVPNQYTVKSDTKVVQPANSSVVISSVEAGTPAATAGLKSNDVVTSIGLPGKLRAIKTTDQFQKATHDFAGQRVQIDYTRNKQAHETVATLNSEAAVTASKNSAHPKYYLGVAFGTSGNGLVVQRSTWSAPVVAVGLTGQLTALTFQGIGHALAGVGSIIAGVSTGNHAALSHGQTQAGSQVGGPIAIIVLLKDSSTIGLLFVLFVIAYISLALAIMNLLPIPGLDGGRLWLTLIMHALKRPLSPKREELVNGAGFAFLMLLFVVLSVVDVKRFF